MVDNDLAGCQVPEIVVTTCIRGVQSNVLSPDYKITNREPSLRSTPWRTFVNRSLFRDCSCQRLILIQGMVFVVAVSLRLWIAIWTSSIHISVVLMVSLVSGFTVQTGLIASRVSEAMASVLLYRVPEAYHHLSLLALYWCLKWFLFFATNEDENALKSGLCAWAERGRERISGSMRQESANQNCPRNQAQKRSLRSQRSSDVCFCYI